MLKKLIFTVLVALPIASWAFVKPVRVLAPELEGLTCVGRVCGRCWGLSVGDQRKAKGHDRKSEMTTPHCSSSLVVALGEDS